MENVDQEKILPSVGRVVKAIGNNWFRSGASHYNDAVIIQLDPFVLTSRDSTMCWSVSFTADTVQMTNEVVTGEVLANCMKRLSNP